MVSSIKKYNYYFEYFQSNIYYIHNKEWFIRIKKLDKKLVYEIGFTDES